MQTTWEILYQRGKSPSRATVIIRPKKNHDFARGAGFVLLALGLGGFLGPFIPAIRLESAYALYKVFPTPAPTPAAIEQPQKQSQEFRLIIPKIGVDSPVIPNVDPTNPGEYDAALLTGVAHSSLSFLPDQNGTVYLFSHSTNYDWFVKELNAVFYLVKNLDKGDTIQISYHGKQYTYTIRDKKIVNPKDISYLVPTVGTKSLILETCWPPGSTYQRLLVMADLVSN